MRWWRRRRARKLAKNFGERPGQAVGQSVHLLAYCCYSNFAYSRQARGHRYDGPIGHGPNRSQ